MEFSPSLIGCIIADGNHSFDLIRSSGKCVINLPTADTVDLVVGIGNCSGRNMGKFEQFDIAVEDGDVVGARCSGIVMRTWNAGSRTIV